jgi:hypothetical protein
LATRYGPGEKLLPAEKASTLMKLPDVNIVLGVES